MAAQILADHLGPDIQDPDEETFLLFSQDIPSQNLGFVDSRATTLDLTVAGRDYVIHQSPTVLKGLLTGKAARLALPPPADIHHRKSKVVWKITPLAADYLASPSNLFWETGVFSSSSTILELGCGISGLVGLALAPSVARYVLSDQSYVAKLVDRNIEENMKAMLSRQSGASAPKRRKQKASMSAVQQHPSRVDLRFMPLDWETDEVTPALTGTDDVKSFDAVIACDCIYNEALIQPLVQACADSCQLRSQEAQESSSSETPSRPTVCIVAQQLRDPEIFEAWIKAFHERFWTWRVPEHALSDALRDNPGFVIHAGVLRDTT